MWLGVLVALRSDLKSRDGIGTGNGNGTYDDKVTVGVMTVSFVAAQRGASMRCMTPLLVRMSAVTILAVIPFRVTEYCPLGA